MNIIIEKLNLYVNKIICYVYVGCFDNFLLFDNVNFDFFCLFEVIGIEFLFFMRRNWNNF